MPVTFTCWISPAAGAAGAAAAGFLREGLLRHQRGGEKRGDQPADFLVLHVHLQCLYEFRL
jgi:hypothetical protein